MLLLRFFFLIIFIESIVSYSERLFASDFRAPQPPNSVIAEYQAAYVQHKWDGTGISHISTGMIYASLTFKRLRMDIIYNSTIASSLFDYANPNSDGTVPNYIYTLAPSTSKQGECTCYNVTPAYPLFPPDILVSSQAAFGGLVIDNLFYADQEPLHVWKLLFGQSTSVTVFLDKNNTVVR